VETGPMTGVLASGYAITTDLGERNNKPIA
jgi:hypothetical protein